MPPHPHHQSPRHGRNPARRRPRAIEELRSQHHQRGHTGRDSAQPVPAAMLVRAPPARFQCRTIPACGRRKQRGKPFPPRKAVSAGRSRRQSKSGQRHAVNAASTPIPCAYRLNGVRWPQIRAAKVAVRAQSIRQRRGKSANAVLLRKRGSTSIKWTRSRRNWALPLRHGARSNIRKNACTVVPPLRRIGRADSIGRNRPRDASQATSRQHRHNPGENLLRIGRSRLTESPHAVRNCLDAGHNALAHPLRKTFASGKARTGPRLLPAGR